ncbi:MAG: hypothetical protein IJH39_00640 [Clostridia bacterium]|nr:hypothetical protein [Clostridia bacterium]
MSGKNTWKNFWLVKFFCRIYKAIKDDFESKIWEPDEEGVTQLTQEEYDRFSKISDENSKYGKGEI